MYEDFTETSDVTKFLDETHDKFQIEGRYENWKVALPLFNRWGIGTFSGGHPSFLTSDALPQLDSKFIDAKEALTELILSTDTGSFSRSSENSVSSKTSTVSALLQDLETLAEGQPMASLARLKTEVAEDIRSQEISLTKTLERQVLQLESILNLLFEHQNFLIRKKESHHVYHQCVRDQSGLLERCLILDYQKAISEGLIAMTSIPENK